MGTRYGSAACAALLLCIGLYGQNISGSLSGSVQDASGSVVPGVEVNLSSDRTGFQLRTRTNESGLFTFPDLTPAAYTLRIAISGFRQYEQTNIEIGSGVQRSLGAIELKVGQTSESVTVEAEAVAVALGSSEKAGTLSAADLESLALKGRDIMDAVALLPGIVDTSDSRDAPSPTSIGNLYIAGGRSNSKNMTIDGVTNLDTGSNGSVHSMPSMDSVSEVKVLQSNYAAEYGRNSGGSITIITKGGTKKFHGSAGWYHRHENYSANDWFNNRNGLDRQPYRYNIASYTISGPIFVPKLLPRNRTKVYFFWSQEFQEQKVGYGSARTVRVPTAAERIGDFSNALDVNNRVIAVRDPLNNNIQFPQNIVPKDRITPIGAAILNLFPLPNFVDPLPARVSQWNYISQASGSYPRRTEIFRTDFQPAKNTQTYLRVSNNADEQHPPYSLWVNGSVNFPLSAIIFKAPGRGATLHSTTTLRPSLFNELIFGVSQNKLYYYPEEPDKIRRSTTGIHLGQWYPDLNPDGYIPNMTFSSVPNYANPTMSNGLPYYNSNTIFSIVENLTKLAGRHAYKFGLYFERTRKDQSANAATRGALNFDRNTNNPLDTNYAYATALLGYYNSYTEATARPQGQYRFTNLEWYFQDAWRAKRRLLIDYGVRFYHNMPQYDARDQLASFVPGLFNPKNAPVLLRPARVNNQVVAQDPISGATYNSTLIGTFVPGVGNPSEGMVIGGVNNWPRGLYTVPAMSIAPRLGFAWDPTGHGKTAIRGGGGVFYDRIQGNPSMGLLSNPPTISSPTIYFGSLADIGRNAGGGILAPSGTVTGLIGNVPMPTVYNFSFGVQQQIGRTLLFDVSYVGSITRNFLWQRNINPVPLRANHLDINPQNTDPTTNRVLNPNFLRPYQGYGNINMFEFGSTSSYNSLQFSMSQRFAKSGTWGISYTFAKALGTSETDTTGVHPFYSPRDFNYGPLDYDRTHVLNLRYNWTIPKIGKKYNFGLARHITDGWELSGITRLQSGAPFTPGFSLVSGLDITGSPTLGARISVLDPNAPPESRFIPPQRGELGNAGEAILRRPGFTNWDLSVLRNIRIGEGRNFQLRVESYNTPNHPQWNSIDQTARYDAQNTQINLLFLQPLTARSPRRVQLAMRLTW
ncbi:MAG: TonB-dependent receptor [Acidobacteria bacterium]|nr:TonB-dependent receptor [Acidobacteriota bacterium]